MQTETDTECLFTGNIPMNRGNKIAKHSWINEHLKVIVSRSTDRDGEWDRERERKVWLFFLVMNDVYTWFVAGLPDLGQSHCRMEPMENAQREGDALHHRPCQEPVEVQLKQKPISEGRLSDISSFYK